MVRMSPPMPSRSPPTISVIRAGSNRRSVKRGACRGIEPEHGRLGVAAAAARTANGARGDRVDEAVVGAASGSALAWSRSFMCSSRSRSTSAAGNVGVIATSAASSSAASRRAPGTSTLKTTYRPRPRRGATRRGARPARSARWHGVSLRPFRQGAGHEGGEAAWSLGSSTAPLGRASEAVTSSRPGKWTERSPRPFDSWCCSNRGKWYCEGSPCFGRSAMRSSARWSLGEVTRRPGSYRR